MAVDRHCHRNGTGRALLDWAQEWCERAGVRWLHVKTRGPSTPDPGYDVTRKFYLACGFEPLFETLDLWGPENAALILIKTIRGASAPGR
jgi:GNAT superfamily N-acetyltransferase